MKAELDRKYGALLAGAVSRPEYEAKTREIMGRVEALTHDLTVIRQDVAVGSPALRALQQLSDTGIGNAEMSAAGLSSQAHHQGDTMAFAIGTSVVTQAQSTTRGPRPGVIEEVLRRDPSPRYRVRWDDGHETIYTPASGTLQAQPRLESVKSNESLVVGRRREYSSAGGHERA